MSTPAFEAFGATLVVAIFRMGAFEVVITIISAFISAVPVLHVGMHQFRRVVVFLISPRSLKME
ncbi:hypothetical protein P171DRAFT_198551 [Karstenula rhodostoma CBS 690.94]|uniref:Uncharacterized protein n=1 Tax=Karstenula rhodostoma CBS 690.94 TaxID=1392251 RepID=A0A9P4UH15_9PLEO|nr:hypothetical protein P171DRAFT_198551 [Karstenula rhodostoma CBS 690.94]